MRTKQGYEGFVGSVFTALRAEETITLGRKETKALIDKMIAVGEAIYLQGVDPEARLALAGDLILDALDHLGGMVLAARQKSEEVPDVGHGFCPACGAWVTEASLVLDWKSELYEEDELEEISSLRRAAHWAVVGCGECWEGEPR